MPKAVAVVAVDQHVGATSQEGVLDHKGVASNHDVGALGSNHVVAKDVEDFNKV